MVKHINTTVLREAMEKADMHNHVVITGRPDVTAGYDDPITVLYGEGTNTQPVNDGYRNWDLVSVEPEVKLTKVTSIKEERTTPRVINP